MFDGIALTIPVTLYSSLRIPITFAKGTFKSSLPTQSNFHLFICFSSYPVCLFAPFDSHKYKYDDVYIFIVCVSFYTHVCVCLFCTQDENRYHEDIFGITLRTAEIHTKSRATARIRMASQP